jgi:hypothetical protein
MPELEVWMRVGPPLEPVLADRERLLDAWQSGGVRGLVVGPMVFSPDVQGDALEEPSADTSTMAIADMPIVPRLRGRPWTGDLAAPVPVAPPNLTVYRRWDVEPPPAPPREFPGRLAQLQRLIESAKGRGWPVYLYQSASGAVRLGAELAGSERLPIVDEFRRRALLAQLEDTVLLFPQADGVLLDGPEWGYELAPGHPSSLWDDLPPEAEPAVQAMGFDYARLVAAKERLQQRLHKLSREMATLASTGGLYTQLALIGNDPGVVSWFTFRTRALTAFYRQVHQLVEALSRARGRQVRLGVSPRLPLFSALCGYDFPAIASLFDLILPKFYIWNRGIDGLYGSVGRYVSTLEEWNPSLWEPECYMVVRALLGLALPSTERDAAPGQTMSTLKELDRGFPDAFFRDVVAVEVKRSIAAADGYPWKVLPWVDAGPRPHGGEPVTAADLLRLLRAVKDGGARHVLYHSHTHLTAAEWSVIAEYCGAGWRAGQGIYGRYLPPGE